MVKPKRRSAAKMTVAQLQMLITRLTDAEAVVAEALAMLWPVGCSVEFIIMDGQVKWSTGTVIAHPSGRDGDLRVRLDSRKSQVRNVSFKSFR